MVLKAKSFGSGDEEEMFSGKEYLLDFNLIDLDFLWATTLLGDSVDVADIEETLVFAGDGGVGTSKSRSVVLGGGCVVPGAGPVLLKL